MRLEAGLVLLVSIVLNSACGVGSEPAQEPPAVHRPPLLSVGEQLNCLVGDDVECWGGNPFLRLGDPNHPATSFQLGRPADRLAIGDHHACLVYDDTVACWGSNLMGQLGSYQPSETCIDRPCAREPVTIQGLPATRTVTAGTFHTVVLAEDGTVWCWGAGSSGQCGAPADPVLEGPRRIEGLPTVTAVAAGGQQSFAVTSDGSVFAWGSTDNGRLGIDTDLPAIARPALVPGLGGPVSVVAAGGAHTCALLADGSVECWGDNRFGQLGDGTSDSRPQPAPVQGIGEPVVELAAGDAFTCALTSSGAVVCWGWNDSGQLGQGAFDGPSEPGGFSAALTAVAVPGLPGPASSVSAGPGFACARISEATWCWGRNEAGQLGDGLLEDHPSAVSVAASTSQTPPASRKPEMSGNRGIDVSYHSGRVDWDEIATQNLGFAFTLSTAGVDYHDPFYDAHWKRMNRLRRGAYHFFVPKDDPAEQARWFIANTPLASGDLVPVLDIETLGDDAPDDLGERLTVFVQTIEAHYGVKPIIYTGPKFWNQNMGEGWGDHLLWIAEYQVDSPTVPKGWRNWTLWQDRGDAQISGVERVVDLNQLAPGFDVSEMVIPDR